jgi:hypothetical protein
MARIRISKNPGHFEVSLSMIQTYIVTNGKSGGNRIIIPCKSKEQAEKLCDKLNALEPSRKHELWL